MYINNEIQYAVELVRNSQRFTEHVNRFRNKEEQPTKIETVNDMAIGRYEQIKMKAKALVDFYKCSSQEFSQTTYEQKFKKQLELIPLYLKGFYYLVVFYNDFDNVMILNSTIVPYFHDYKS